MNTALFLTVTFLLFSQARAMEIPTSDYVVWMADDRPNIAEIVISDIVIKKKTPDIGVTALRLAKEFYPDLNVASYSAAIDVMVDAVREQVKGSQDPEVRIRALNDYFFKTMKITYDFDDLKAQKMENRFINGLIDRHKGSCLTMPVLYLAVAQRLKYPIYPVFAPRHLFLRYVDSKNRGRNIEVTSGGGEIPNDEYQIMMPATKVGVEKGAYFKTTNYRAMVAELIAESAYQWGAKSSGSPRNMKRAIRNLEISAVLDPVAPATYRLLSIAYESLSKVAPPMFTRITKNESEVAAKRATDLGLAWQEAKEDYVSENAKKLMQYRDSKNPPVKGAL